MRVYTRTGDDGQTYLANGERVDKHHFRVSLYGTVDELNSSIGVGIAALRGTVGPDHSKSDLVKRTADQLESQQNLLFELGSELAGYVPMHQTETGVIYDSDIQELEEQMDVMLDEIPDLKAFVLPGGTSASAHLHVARTICRRLEREMALLIFGESENEAPDFSVVREAALKFVNRLSDYLFVNARYANFLADRDDIKWQSRARERDKNQAG